MTHSSPFIQHDQNVGQSSSGHGNFIDTPATLSPNQGSSLNDAQLQEQFRVVQQIETASSNKIIELQTRLSEAEKRLKHLSQIAKEKYGVQSLKELKELLESNQAHNQQVIPQAYQNAINIRDIIKNIEQKIGQ